MLDGSDRLQDRRNWVGLVVGIAVLTAVGAGLAAAFHRYREPVRIASSLPAGPDLNGKPSELRDRMSRARLLTLGRATAFDGMVEFGRLCHANGFTGEAETCWRVLIAEQPGNARWTYYLADLRRLANDYDGMAEWLTKTTQLNPNYAPAWLRLAELRFKTGQLGPAEQAYRKRLALLPGDAYASLGLARLTLQYGRREEAREQIKQLVNSAPAFSAGHNFFAEMLESEGSMTHAVEQRVLGRATGRFREADDPWMDELMAWCFDYDRLCVRGAIDSQTNFGDRGKAAFELAIRLRPGDLEAYNLLGVLYIESKEPAKACEIYEQGLLRATNRQRGGRCYANLSRAYRILQKSAEAVRVAREGLENCGPEATLYDALGTALGDLGQHEAAVEALSAAVAGNSGDASINYNLAVALVAVHRLDKAVDELHRSLSLEPTFPSSLALLAQIEIDSGRWQTALQYLQPLYNSHPEVPGAREMMARFYLNAGQEAERNRDLTAAEHDYRAGVQVHGENAEIQARLGMLYLIQRRFAEAVEPLETYYRMQPQNPRAALCLGEAFAALGRRKEAQQILTGGAQMAEREGNFETAQHCREILADLALD